MTPGVKINRPWFRHYPKHVPRSLQYPAFPVHHFLTRTAALRPGDIAMTFNGQDTTYGAFDAWVNRFASVLQKQGIEKGDRVALILVNSPIYAISFFALMKLGACAVNLSVGISGAELVFCLQNAGARVVITLDVFIRHLYEVISETPVRTVVVHSVFGLEKKLPQSKSLPKSLIYADVMAEIQDAPEPTVEVSTDDVAVLQYTSGSTGLPKAATLLHGNLVASVCQSDAWMGIDDLGNAPVLCIIPFFHVFGLVAGLITSVKKGYRMLICPRMDAMDILSVTQMLKTLRPVSFPAVPSLWNAILSLPDDQAKDHLSSIRVAITGGAPVPPGLHDRYTALTGKKLLEAYGLSEAASATHVAPYPAGAPVGSIGLPLPDTDAKIVDIETGQRTCPPGEIGELAVKGPQVMRRYWNNDELTAAVLKDGWFFTRDLARMDEEGFFYLVDRKDDMIICKGFNVYPNEIETFLKRHPAVADAAVVGKPDRLRGQSVVAFVVLKEGDRTDPEALWAYCREGLPDYRRPKAILIRDSIPRDPSGKVLRKDLKGNI
jgi:long-chain acyl-CoA synthetase